eukprot:CAMPEP_0117649192 /NCGR_PEP_ID=MMETSP0804-20121206/833_1 /TAXON_ID=1074897 /ORGANISM="Tetraselmis astigmatica, Strain CCMP880" /LENGTH=115 /DNA_ID=CAMNT_0005454897 /DNA_START=431 /DNA_END=778 /DNA_ORIENTATION=+
MLHQAGYLLQELWPHDVQLRVAYVVNASLSVVGLEGRVQPVNGGNAEGWEHNTHQCRRQALAAAEVNYVPRLGAGFARIPASRLQHAAQGKQHGQGLGELVCEFAASVDVVQLRG